MSQSITIRRGTAENDTLFGTLGSDSIVGRAGDDLLFGGVVEPGPGIVIGPVEIPGMPVFGDGPDTIRGGQGDDLIVGSGGNDLLVGGVGSDIIEGGAGADVIYGGNDSDGANWQLGGDGDLVNQNGLLIDIVSYLTSTQAVTVDLQDSSKNAGGAAGDQLFFINGAFGSELGDKLSGRANVGSLLLGNGGNDTLLGFGGADSLSGGTGADSVSGGGGADSLGGGYGADTVRGDAGSDVLFGGLGTDKLTGGAGNDIIYADNLPNEVVTTLPGADGQPGNDFASGGAGNDIIHGGGGNDRLYGDQDDDSLSGEAGNDELIGGTGDDRLVGGAGADTLRGGDGADVFVFAAGDSTDTVRDLIAGFQQGVDKIDLSAFDVTFADIVQTTVLPSAGPGKAAQRVVYVDLGPTGFDAGDFFLTMNKPAALLESDFIF